MLLATQQFYTSQGTLVEVCDETPQRSDTTISQCTHSRPAVSIPQPRHRWTQLKILRLEREEAQHEQGAVVNGSVHVDHHVATVTAGTH